ncbi:Unconventional myosin-XIX [Portunus trituberculatus]|uniref:Unconventional myosin-XIX n=1 Tax=Portunus trituberculatus TaxID=210409 RepID=A0A5B7E503_PORTR|nr:Unconventional myosin-XIX [Portunus trituberculatus]
MVIDSHVSVFAILNEECQLKRDVKEEEACVRICNALEDTGVVSAPPYHKPNPGFVIKHYAGPVQYEAHGQVDKEYMVQQLRACGIIETVCISQAGYPVRIIRDYLKQKNQALKQTLKVSMVTVVSTSHESCAAGHSCKNSCKIEVEFVM